MLKYLLLYVLAFTFQATGMAQEKKPFDIKLYFNRSINDADRFQVNESINQYSQQINSNPNDPSLYINRGVQYALLGLYPDAISDYNKAIKIDSTLAEVYYNRGIAKSRFGYTKGACIDIKKSAQLGLHSGKSIYEKKCGLFIKALGELP